MVCTFKLSNSYLPSPPPKLICLSSSTSSYSSPLVPRHQPPLNSLTKKDHASCLEIPSLNPHSPSRHQLKAFATPSGQRSLATAATHNAPARVPAFPELAFPPDGRWHSPPSIKRRHSAADDSMTTAKETSRLTQRPRGLVCRSRDEECATKPSTTPVSSGAASAALEAARKRTIVLLVS